MDRFIRFFFACAPGIAIGLWLARQLEFWWPLGAVAGAMTSYALVEWKEVIRAVPSAIDQSSDVLADWLLDATMWKARAVIWGASVSVFLSVSAISFVNAWCFANIAAGSTRYYFLMIDSSYAPLSPILKTV